MADIDRPNRNVLDRALAIYRDSMREFLIRNLKRVPRQTLEKGVESACGVTDDFSWKTA